MSGIESPKVCLPSCELSREYSSIADTRTGVGSEVYA